MMRFATAFLAAFAATLALPTASVLAQDAVAERPAEKPLWAFEDSDIPVDPAFRFGVLDNGMRYILRENATPEGTALVRLHIGSGSLDETDKERGLAHFLEHMAFNGSRRIPEGEMVKLLEREGLAFGADTNASTSFEQTVYKLNLPRNNEELLDTALMLMRETASELSISQEAVDRERGVILSERRDRRNFAYKEIEDRLAFTVPGARYADRLPIGVIEVLEHANADDIRAFYRRTYVPANAVVVIVGDYPLTEMEAKVRRWFGDWEAAPDPAKPEAGPIDIARSSDTDIYVDPALPERLRIMRFRPWDDRPDTVVMRQQNILRQVGYAIVNRRFQALARGEDAPFRGAGFGTGDVFEDARMTSLVIDTEDGGWARGLDVATVELRRALQYGFSQGEVDEQVAKIRSALEASVRGSSTRTNGALMNAALGLLDEQRVPSTPESSLERFEAFANSITPEATLAALRDDAAKLAEPLIRFEGRSEPDGGAPALRAAWESAMQIAIAAPEKAETKAFAYTDFGPPGVVASYTTDDRFGFHLIRFSNGVRLTLKQTDIRKDKISFRLTLDGGQLMETREDPLKTALVSSIPSGGLGAHSQDELESVLAGRRVRLSVSSQAEGFQMGGSTTPDDLQLQMQLLAAALTDPGYRQEGEERFRRNVKTFFASLDATPAQALGNKLGEILSDGDPRFSLQPEEAYQDLTFSQLAADIGDRLKHGAIELALVGDFEPQAAIDAVAATLGALPAREADFQLREAARTRQFTQDHSTRTVTHNGEPDQAMVRMTWLTTDDRDLAEALRLNLLNRVVDIELQEQLREELGKTYSPSSSSSPSKTYHGYGTFSLTASVDVNEVEATRAAIRAMLADLLARPVNEDTLARARQPLLESYDNMLKSLGGWMSLADLAQSEADRLQRFIDAPEIIESISAEDIRATAQRYLGPGKAVEILVLPEGQTR
ncbi:M16 family metallopeptidase [Altererythrobacter sp.]|uniref:M16 family metallopeptidase n=1 Tax=Altererythrobacter sp. TaxID=1872480 RepID=UPI003D0D6937